MGFLFVVLACFVEAVHRGGRAYADCEVITTALEHPSVRGIMDELQKKGVVVRYVPVDTDGRIDSRAFEQLLSPHTVLVSFAYANSEIGVVQDVKKITRSVRKHRIEYKSVFPYVHVDASQAPLYLPCALDSLGIDCMTLDSAKFYGPKGCGVFAKKTAVPLVPLFFGGSQEEGVRPGTENTPLIVGCALAFSLAQQRCEERAREITILREYAIDALLGQIEGVVLNGSRASRIANNINISIPGVDGEYATVVLDHHGFAVSTKSACSGASGSGSQVIYAMGGDDARALATLRITLGEETTKRNIDDLVRVLRSHVEKTKQAIDQINKK